MPSLRYQLAPRNTPMLSAPLPFQSPTTGMSVGMPNRKLWWIVADRLSQRYHMASRTMPIVSWPLPFQSPTTGRSPACRPNVMGPRVPVVMVCRRLQRPRRASRNPIPCVPSPFQSPATG